MFGFIDSTLWGDRAKKNENINILQKEDKVFFDNLYRYDALGRTFRNQRRNNYYKKKTAIVASYEIKSFVLAQNNVTSGYVEGMPRIRWCYEKLVSNEETSLYKLYKVNIEMHIESGPIHTETKDPLLLYHEQQHKTIWDDPKYNITDSITISISSELTTKKKCIAAEERIWPYVRDSLFELYTRHNDWDDRDTNNVNDHRFNVYSTLNDIENTLRNACK